MRKLILPALIAIALLSACGQSEPTKPSNGNTAAMPAATNRQSAQSANASQPDSAPPLATAHEAPQGTNEQTPTRTSSSVDTSALDKQIEQAEAKAKAPSAPQTEKRAAAALYLQRANVFYSAGNPTLYKFALRDFRFVLRYDPQNEEARAKHDQIVQIYKSMGRPVPELGNEP